MRVQDAVGCVQLIYWTKPGTINVNYIKSNDMDIKLGPNPTGDIVNVILPKYDDYLFTLSNNLGQVLVTHQTTTEKTKFDLSQMKPGIYYLKASNGKSTTTRKIIKN